MNETYKTGLAITFVVALMVFLLFIGWAMTGATMSAVMMGSGSRGEISWMWIPTLITLGVGILFVWAIFRKK